MTTGIELLQVLQARGDEPEVQQGRLVIHPKSGAKVPREWLRENEAKVLIAICQTVGIEALEYLSFSTGWYGKKRYPGVTLQFRSVITGELFYAIFNAHLTRQRNSRAGRKGEPLRNKQFRVGNCSHFYRFWLRTGLKFPPRLSAFSGCMGNLRGVLFSATVGGRARIDVSSLFPLSVSSHHVRDAIALNSRSTRHGQDINNLETSIVNIDCAQPAVVAGLQRNSGACVLSYGNKVSTRKRGNKEYHKPPQCQSTEEWLDVYKQADAAV